MLQSELVILADKIKARQAEMQTVEVKATHKGCPEKLQDTPSSISNRDSGGTIAFGLDEKAGRRQKEVGRHRFCRFAEHLVPDRRLRSIWA